MGATTRGAKKNIRRSTLSLFGAYFSKKQKRIQRLMEKTDTKRAIRSPKWHFFFRAMATGKPGCRCMAGCKRQRSRRIWCVPLKNSLDVRIFAAAVRAGLRLGMFAPGRGRPYNRLPARPLQMPVLRSRRLRPVYFPAGASWRSFCSVPFSRESSSSMIHSPEFRRKAARRAARFWL